MCRAIDQSQRHIFASDAFTFLTYTLFLCLLDISCICTFTTSPTNTGGKVRVVREEICVTDKTELYDYSFHPTFTVLFRKINPITKYSIIHETHRRNGRTKWVGRVGRLKWYERYSFGNSFTMTTARSPRLVLQLGSNSSAADLGALGANGLIN